MNASGWIGALTRFEKQSKAKPSKAKQSKAKQSKAKQSTAKQRLQTTEILRAFGGMGASVEQLREERVRLLTEGSYLREWSDPGWMYPECALGECSVIGHMQYVPQEGQVCDWCAKHALQNY